MFLFDSPCLSLVNLPTHTHVFCSPSLSHSVTPLPTSIWIATRTDHKTVWPILSLPRGQHNEMKPWGTTTLIGSKITDNKRRGINLTRFISFISQPVHKQITSKKFIQKSRSKIKGVSMVVCLLGIGFGFLIFPWSPLLLNSNCCKDSSLPCFIILNLVVLLWNFINLETLIFISLESINCPLLLFGLQDYA